MKTLIDAINKARNFGEKVLPIIETYPKGVVLLFLRNFLITIAETTDNPVEFIKKFSEESITELEFYQIIEKKNENN